MNNAEFLQLLEEKFMTVEALRVEHARILSELLDSILKFVRTRSTALNLANLASLKQDNLAFTLGKVSVIVESAFPESGFRLKAEGDYKASESLKDEDELRTRLAYIVALALSMHLNASAER